MRSYTPFGASASLSKGANISAAVAQEIFPAFGINGILIPEVCSRGHLCHRAVLSV